MAGKCRTMRAMLASWGDCPWRQYWNSSPRRGPRQHRCCQCAGRQHLQKSFCFLVSGTSGTSTSGPAKTIRTTNAKRSVTATSRNSKADARASGLLSWMASCAIVMWVKPVRGFIAQRLEVKSILRHDAENDRRCVRPALHRHGRGGGRLRQTHAPSSLQAALASTASSSAR